MVSVGVLLFIPAALIAWGLRNRGRPRAAAFVLGAPLGMIVLSILLTILVLVLMWLYGARLSRNPGRLFESTFGFAPPPETEFLEAYAELGMDWEDRVMMFRVSSDVVARICAGVFSRTDRTTCIEMYEANAHHLPDQVRSWSWPALEKADCFYLAKPFDDSFSVVNEAILCYSEQTGIAFVHWSGLD